MHGLRRPLLISAVALSMAVVACGTDTSTNALPASPSEPPPTASLSTRPASSPTVQQSNPPAPPPRVARQPTPSAQMPPVTARSGPRPTSPTGRSGGFVPLDNPAFLSASQAHHLSDDELVLGYESEGEARAYPINMMRYHHIVNDSVRGSPLLITY